MQGRNIIISEYERHDYLLSSDKLKPRQRRIFEDIYYDEADDAVYFTALKILSDCLKLYHSKCCYTHRQVRCTS